MHILLTNDDSHTSPLFRFAIGILKTLGHLTIVIPKKEQSWTGKSMSRFRPLSLSNIQLQGNTVYCVDGTPADCVNMGVYHICQQPPDLIVSGINIGINAGMGFFFASGTIGACLEANIAGIPAIALSQHLDRQAFQNWMQQQCLPPDEEERLRTQTQALLERVFATLLARDDFLCQPVTWNVNLPRTAAPNWHLVPTVLGHTVYGSCFKKHGDQYRHDLELPQFDTRHHADGTVVQQGQVSITYINIRELAQTIVQP
ncbi:5'/3'-nucleotidase SurE [Candidatus Entotheonellaceae bacterium PAL068K]